MTISYNWFTRLLGIYTPLLLSTYRNKLYRTYAKICIGIDILVHKVDSMICLPQLNFNNPLYVHCTIACYINQA